VVSDALSVPPVSWPVQVDALALKLNVLGEVLLLVWLKGGVMVPDPLKW
jgi:hypothetical protein